VISLLLAYSQTEAAYCSGKPDEGERVSNYPIFDGPLRYRRSVKNGMLFEAGPLNASFPVVHLWGTPYEAGFAQGTLLKQTIKDFVYKTWGYLVTELVNEMDGDLVPPFAKALIADRGMERALDWTADVTAPFTTQDYYDEVRGLSDASGVSYDTLYRLNMFPELTKASCSFFGAWGSSVKTAGQTYQLRALDFDTTGPFKDFPQVTVYHPTNGHAYAQVGWPGVVGALTGVSSEKIAVSEIGVSFADDSFGQGTENTPPEKVKGKPWMHVLRDVLQFDNTFDDAKTRVTNANKTCNLILGIGDGKSGVVNGVEYSGHVANFYDDKNQLPVNETWHPVIPDVVYNGMDWLCPAYTNALGTQLSKYHGALDENVVVSNILPTVQTGDLHAAVYDLTNNNLHVSFCRSANADPTEPHYAYERQFTRLHMTDIFAQQPSTHV